jgi:hypothetical protein
MNFIAKYKFSYLLIFWARRQVENSVNGTIRFAPSTSVRILTNRKAINENPCDYLYSSAKFYMEGGKLFSFLKDLRNEF